MAGEATGARGAVHTGRARAPEGTYRGGHTRYALTVEPAADLTTRPAVFAAMPFDPAFDDVYYVAIRSAVERVGGIPVRVDHLMHGQDAAMETRRQIERCGAVVADLSTGESDVLYELGYAHALGKPVVQLCSTAYDQLPFMVRNHDTILYRPGQVHLLVDQLAAYLSRLLEAP